MCLFCSNFHTTNAYSAATSTALYRFQRPTTNQTHLDKRWSEPGQTTYCLPTYLLNQTRTQSEEEEQEGEEEAATEEESEPARTCPVSFSPSLSLSRSLASALLCSALCVSLSTDWLAPTGSAARFSLAQQRGTWRRGSVAAILFPLFKFEQGRENDKAKFCARNARENAKAGERETDRERNLVLTGAKQCSQENAPFLSAFRPLAYSLAAHCSAVPLCCCCCRSRCRLFVRRVVQRERICESSSGKSTARETERKLSFGCSFAFRARCEGSRSKAHIKKAAAAAAEAKALHWRQQPNRRIDGVVCCS